MNLIIKHSLKNIFSKPLRLLLLVFCITFASFAALLAVDMRNNIEGLMKGYMMDMIGKMDIIIMNASPEALEEVEDIADIRKVGISQAGLYEYERDTTGYEYSFEKYIDVTAISDMKAAYDMAFITEELEIDDGTAVISKEYAEHYGYGVGDTIELETRDEEILKLKVIKLIDIKNIIWNGEYIIVSNENLRRISCLADNDYEVWLIDVADDSRISEIADHIRSNDPGAMLEVISEMEDNGDIEQLYNLFYLLFLISFLLVIFVTISIAEKIVNERMSVIGTLRSLGVTQGKTAFVLLIENILYAVLGTVLGIWLYSVIKPVFLESMLTVSADTGKAISHYITPTPFWVYLLVLLGAVIVECAYPLYELSKAVKTPIRDIIFENKDTEFRYKWSRLYTGIVLGVVAVVAGLLVKNFFTLAVSFACGVVATAVLIPFIIRIISRLISGLCRKLSFPIAQLAAENMSRNRIIMGTAVLCVTSLTLSLLIGGVGASMLSDLDSVNYDCDVIVDIQRSDDDHTYRYIRSVEGVEETDYVYVTPVVQGAINDEKSREFTILSDTEHSIITELPAEGYGLKDDEIVISKELAKRYKLNAGDEIRFVFNPDGDFPTERHFTIRDTMELKNSLFSGIATVVISRDLYDHAYAGRLGDILIRTSDPDALKDKIEKSSETEALSVETMAEREEEKKKNASGLTTVIRLIVAGSTALTLIGIAGNQSLGFITRKRETALLYSVALPRHKLKRLIFLESFFSMGISAVVAGLAAPFLYRVLAHLFDVIGDGNMDIMTNGGIGFSNSLTYMAVILIVYLLTTLIPAGYLRKMNIAEELKYE